MSEWKPIDEAAKHGGDVWAYGLAKVWANSTPFMWQGQAGWSPEDDAWITTSHDDTGAPLYIIPTHYRPLPPAPEPTP
jgi:hypothetical protein